MVSYIKKDNLIELILILQAFLKFPKYLIHTNAYRSHQSPLIKKVFN